MTRAQQVPPGQDLSWENSEIRVLGWVSAHWDTLPFQVLCSLPVLTSTPAIGSRPTQPGIFYHLPPSG